MNSSQAYFGILKRSSCLTHIWVSAKHLPKYLAEFEYRTSLRGTPKLMCDLMLSFKRLVPKPDRPRRSRSKTEWQHAALP